MKLGWRGAIGFALSALLLAWTLRDVRFADVWRQLSTASLPLLLLSAATATAIFPLRARRWRTILEPVEERVAFGKLWRSTAIGMMVNNVIPARAGEIARAYALTREEPSIPFSAAFASLAVDRLFDAVVVLALMFLAMLDPRFPRGTAAGDMVANWAGTGTIFLAALVTVLYLLVFFPGRVIGIYEAFARRVSPRFEARGRDVLSAFAAGLGVLRNPRRFLEVLFWTVVHWLTNALAFWIAFKALGMATAGYGAALFLQGLISVGVALPSSPGFFGVFEAAARTGLTVYGVNSTQATSWAIGFHLLSFIPITVMGAVYFARLGLHLGEIAGAAAGDAPEPGDAPDRVAQERRRSQGAA